MISASLKFWTMTEAGFSKGMALGRRRRMVAPAIGIALAGLLLAGCTTMNTGGGSGTLVSRADPVDDRVGSDEHPRIIAAYGGVYHDSKLEQTLARIVGRVVAASDKPDQSYRITILNSPSVNAFALPGGYLYVTRGLLALANDSSEVAAVLAHEMAHVTADHAMARQNKARTAVIVGRVVADVLDDDAGQLALASSQRSLASFSRQQELEADAIGVKTIGRAGYDPFAASRFLTAMSRYAAYRSGLSMQDKRPDFLASHPSTPERIDFAMRAARQFGAPGLGEIDRDRYLEGIDGMVFGDDPEQGFVRDRSFLHPSLGVSFTVPEGFVIDNASDAVLATGADGTALHFDAVALKAGADLGAYLASGWLNGFVEGSVVRFTVNGLPAASAQANAKGWAYRIAVVQAQSGATCRFIFANESDSAAFAKAAEETVGSFRMLAPAEAAKLDALRIKVVTVKPGDSEQSLARKMRGVDRPLELFRTLNDLRSGEVLPVGTKVKIIED
jgi:predicted Zn-dependent protease